MLLTTLDRRDTSQIKTLDRVFMELSPFMTAEEVDQVVIFMNTISTSKIEGNWTADDAISQLRIMLGQERVYNLKAQWSAKNQHLIERVDNKIKYVCNRTQQVYDGLDPHDDPADYTVIKM